MPQISLRHVLSHQHERVVLLANSQEQDNVVVSQSSQQLNLSLEILYLLARLLPQYFDSDRLAAKAIGFVHLQLWALFEFNAFILDSTLIRPYLEEH